MHSVESFTLSKGLFFKGLSRRITDTQMTLIAHFESTVKV